MLCIHWYAKCQSSELQRSGKAYAAVITTTFKSSMRARQHSPHFGGPVAWIACTAAQLREASTPLQTQQSRDEIIADHGRLLSLSLDTLVSALIEVSHGGGSANTHEARRYNNAKSSTAGIKSSTSIINR